MEQASHVTGSSSGGLTEGGGESESCALPSRSSELKEKQEGVEKTPRERTK